MAKADSGKGSSLFGPVSGRLPLDYGEQTSLRKMSDSKVHSQPKEEADSCPHPKATQEEGPAGRKSLGSEMIGVKKTPFNRLRGDCM